MLSFTFYNPENDEDSKEFIDRARQMTEHRRSYLDVDIERLWRWADKDCRLSNRLSGVNQTEDPDKPSGFLGTANGPEEWRSDSVSAKTLTKMYTASSLLFDRNPEAHPEAVLKRYEQIAKLATAKLNDSHEKEKFKEKLKVFMFYAMKYGTAYGRTYIKKTKRTVWETATDAEGKEIENRKTVEDLKEYFDNLNTWDVWVDELTRPGDIYGTMNDWMWRELVSDESITSEYGKGDVIKTALQAKKTGLQQTSSDSSQVMDSLRQDINEVFHYENKAKDLKMTWCNGHLIKKSRLPNHKRLTLIMMNYALRDGMCPYGIGVPELMRESKMNYDKFKNANMDIAAWMSAASFLTSGGGTEDSTLRLEPGTSRNVMNAKETSFFKPPTLDPAAVSREASLAADIDDDTGITQALSGQVNIAPNIPASYLNMAKDAALQRLKPVLDNLLVALEYEASLRWKLIADLGMSQLDIRRMTEPNEIDSFMQRYGEYKELYTYNNDGSVDVKNLTTFNAPMMMSDTGELLPSGDVQEFFFTPDMMEYDGGFVFRSEAVLVRNKELEKQLKLEMWTQINPFFSQDPALFKKGVRRVIAIYGEDFTDWVPDSWLVETPPQVQPQVPQQAPTQTPGAQVNPVDPNGQSMMNQETALQFPHDTRP